MAKKKKHGGGMSETRKLGKQVLGIIRVAVITLTVGHGAVGAGIEVAQNKNVGDFPRVMVFKYSGFDWNSGQWNSQQAFNSALTIGTGLAVGKALSWAIKHV